MCDLILWPFYYGNIRYIIDSLKNGVIGPYLATEKTYIESEIKSLYYKLNIEDFIANDKEEYINIMYDLIDNRINQKSARLLNLSKKFKPYDLNKILLNSNSKVESSNKILSDFLK